MNDTLIEFIVNTGSEVTLLTKASSDMLKLCYRKSNKMVLATNGTDVGILGECEVNIANNDHYCLLPVAKFVIMLTC